MISRRVEKTFLRDKIILSVVKVILSVVERVLSGVEMVFSRDKMLLIRDKIPFTRNKLFFTRDKMFFTGKKVLIFVSNWYKNLAFYRKHLTINRYSTFNPKEEFLLCQKEYDR